MPKNTKLNILMIEDNPSDQFLLTHMLQSSELKIHLLLCADRLEKAIDILKTEVIHIILLDLFLPDSAGIESLQALKVYAGKTPVVILSGQADMKLSLKAITMGAQDYLLKGDFDVHMLNKTILYSIERMNNLEALRESNERYDLVSKATNDMVWDWNLVTGEVYRNKEGWRKLLKDEFDKKSAGTEEEWDLRIHPEDKLKVKQVKEELFGSNTKNLYEVECRILRNDNTYAYIQDRGYIMRNGEGKAVRLIGATQDISERKEAELELKKLSLIAQETSNAVIITATDGKIQWINDAFTRITGYHLEEVVGKIPVDFLGGPDTNAEDEAYMRACVTNLEAFECDVINYSKDGRKYWVHIQSQPQFDQNGRHTGFFALETDITNEKNIKELIVNSERRFRSLIENSTDGLTLINSEARVIDTSFAAERILGYTKQQYLGMAWTDLIQPADQELVQQTFDDVIKKDNTTKNIEFRIRKESGQYIWIESTFHNLLQDTAVNAVVINFRDISDRMQAAALLIESEEKYKYLFNNNPACIMIWSISDYKILEVNDTAVKQYGYDRQEFLSLNMLNLRVADEYPRIREFARKANADPDFKVLYTWKHINKLGEEMYMNILSCRITYKGKDVILALATNVTDKVILEKRLAEEKQRRQLEVTEAVITAQENERQEIGRELHDNVNQILSSSRLYLGLAKSPDVANPFLDQTDGLINKAITEIRDLSHSLIPPSLNESELIEALNNIIILTTKGGGPAIQKDFRSVDEDFLSDKLKLAIYRVVQEQFNNILKYAKAKLITIKLTQEADIITLSIKDDGVGFNTTDKPKVGVGLMNIRTRASLFNGEMNINSHPGKGSELKVSFRLI